MMYKYSDLVKKEDSSAFIKECFQNFVNNISNPDFPCYFAKNVLTKDSLYMAFIEGKADKTAAWTAAAEVMAIYAEIEKNPDPYRVLVISFDLPSPDWESDDALLWEFLTFLRASDHSEWPKDIPSDANEKGWSFCFMGIPWFFNVNSPNHIHRKSRNVTGHYSFVVQRTDGFDDLAPFEQHDALRKGLRSRIANYDGQSTSPALAGETDNPEMLEWIQYHLPEFNNQKPLGKCPFHNK